MDDSLMELFDPVSDDEEQIGIDRVLRDPKNKEFRKGFLSLLSANEITGLITDDGVLTKDGISRIKSALFAKSFSSPEGQKMVASYIDEADPDLKSVESALFSALPLISKVTQQAKTGTIAPEFDPTDEIAQAVMELARIKNDPSVKGNLERKVEEELGRVAMPGMGMGSDRTEFQKILLRHLSKIATKPRVLASFLNNWMNRILQSKNPNQQSLFQDEISQASPLELLQLAIGSSEKSYKAYDVIQKLIRRKQFYLSR